MDTLQTHIDPADPVFHSNRDRMQQLAGELRERLAGAREGGGAVSADVRGVMALGGPGASGG